MTFEIVDPLPSKKNCFFQLHPRICSIYMVGKCVVSHLVGQDDNVESSSVLATPVLDTQSDSSGLGGRQSVPNNREFVCETMMGLWWTAIAKRTGHVLSTCVHVFFIRSSETLVLDTDSEFESLECKNGGRPNAAVDIRAQEKSVTYFWKFAGNASKTAQKHSNHAPLQNAFRPRRVQLRAVTGGGSWRYREVSNAGLSVRWCALPIFWVSSVTSGATGCPESGWAIGFLRQWYAYQKMHLWYTQECWHWIRTLKEQIPRAMIREASGCGAVNIGARLLWNNP